MKKKTILKISEVGKFSLVQNNDILKFAYCFDLLNA